MLVYVVLHKHMFKILDKRQFDTYMFKKAVEVIHQENLDRLERDYNWTYVTEQVRAIREEKHRSLDLHIKTRLSELESKYPREYKKGLLAAFIAKAYDTLKRDEVVLVLEGNVFSLKKECDVRHLPRRQLEHILLHKEKRDVQTTLSEDGKPQPSPRPLRDSKDPAPQAKLAKDLRDRASKLLKDRVIATTTVIPEVNSKTIGAYVWKKLVLGNMIKKQYPHSKLVVPARTKADQLKKWTAALLTQPKNLQKKSTNLNLLLTKATKKIEGGKEVSWPDPLFMSFLSEKHWASEMWTASNKPSVGGFEYIKLTYVATGPDPKITVTFPERSRKASKPLIPVYGVIKQKKSPRDGYASKIRAKIPRSMLYFDDHKLTDEASIDHTMAAYYKSAVVDYKTKNVKLIERMRGAPTSYMYPDKKRLLWVNKQIILPTETPITIITNSFDVMHSWFIPGLALKLDCVPGRSTHHTIYIEHPGYYYGQCAEICGRRHHHMPIKIYAVPFREFIFWWRNKYST